MVKNMKNEIRKIEGENEIVKALKKLKENITKIKISNTADNCYIENYYNQILEAVREYEDVSLDSLDEFFRDYISRELIEEEALDYARCGDLMSIQYLLKDLDLICATFKRYKYIGFAGGIRNINREDIKELKENILNYIDNELIGDED